MCKFVKDFHFACSVLLHHLVKFKKMKNVTDFLLGLLTSLITDKFHAARKTLQQTKTINKQMKLLWHKKKELELE